MTDFILDNIRIIELIVFWYPVSMGFLWVIGSLIYYYRIERKKPLPLIDTPMVSVLVPAYNEGINIINTIEKLNQMDYPNFEIIIINDGSNDNSPEIISKLTELYSHVRFIDLKENCGKANALYLGLMASKGEYLVCVDGDSYLDKDCIRYMIPHFINPHNGERVGAVTGNPRVRNRSSLLAKIQLCEYASIISLIKRTQRIWGKVMTVSGVVVAYRKRALLDCGLWDRDIIAEDIGVTWKLEKSFWDIRYEPRAICWMLVPETVKGLFRQRRRWAQGGQEVILRHANIFKHWSARRMIPVFIEQIMSTLWVVLWLLLTFVEIFKLSYDFDSYYPYLWKSQFLAFVCISQFFVAIRLERKYDKNLMRSFLVAAWYPLVYWVVSGLVALTAIPATISSRKNKLATWTSPDRGIGTGDMELEKLTTDQVYSFLESSITINNETRDKTRDKTTDKITDNTTDKATDNTTDNTKDKATDKANTLDKVLHPEIKKHLESEINIGEYKYDIISGKQKKWKVFFAVIGTTLAWSVIFVYFSYIVYGFISIRLGYKPIEIWIYNIGMIYETKKLLYYTFIIILVECLFLIYWKEYNRIKFGGLNRRKFKADVGIEEIAIYFNKDLSLVKNMQESNKVTFVKNIIPNNFVGNVVNLDKIRSTQNENI